VSGEVQATTGHDMSRYWRLVSNDGGLITGTWCVTRKNRRGEQHVKPIDVTMWSEGRHSGLRLHSEDFTAFVKDGQVKPLNVRARHSHVESEANARLDEIAAAVLVVAAAPEWPDDHPTPPAEPADEETR
jgi:hypothetical protein